jgi:hypothetical protein
MLAFVIYIWLLCTLVMSKGSSKVWSNTGFQLIHGNGSRSGGLDLGDAVESSRHRACEASTYPTNIKG